MYTPEEIEAFSMIFDNAMRSLEIEVMEDVIRRIKINGEITRSADWQLYRLYELGKSKKSLRKAIKKAFNLDESSINQLYQNIIGKGYARDETLYKAKGKQFIPFEKNEALQQYISAIAKQTIESMQNISQSLGFTVKSGDKRVFKPIAKYYQTTLDNAINGIATGVFDYNTALKQTVSEMTNSGLRTVDYETGWSNRVDVAARRAVMTGLTQVTAKINENNAEKLGTDMFEVSWHSGARPSHQVWQGRWYKSSELESVCGLGSVTGLCGANCYHSYYPVIPGISVPTYTEEELDEMNRQENIPIDYNGKQYTKYEALQRQRQLETRMRAERQKIKLLQDGEADETDIMLARAKYRGTSQEYTSFSKAMELPQQRQRVTIDGLENIGVGKWKIPVDFQKVKARYKDSEGLFITFDARTPDKGRDVIKPHNIIKNLNKSDIGKEMLEFIKKNNIPVYLSYGSDIADESLLGYYGSGIITVFVDNTKSVNETACIIVHEATHAQIDKPNTKNQELKCYKNEYMHRGIKLTDEIIQSIIKHIDDSYPYLEWE
nr:MAG TPA: minor capsid protein [Caudoviricetes sp.]